MEKTIIKLISGIVWLSLLIGAAYALLKERSSHGPWGDTNSSISDAVVIETTQVTSSVEAALRDLSVSYIQAIGDPQW